MRVELKIDGVTCLSCAEEVERALLGVSGVEDARVSYPSGRATVTAAERVEPQALVSAAARGGYRASLQDVRPAPSGAERSPRAPAEPADDEDHDLVIIGSGAAGTAAAIRAAEIGARVAVVEAAQVVGGTCVNVGCIPSKYLVEAAHHFHTARTRFPGIAACRPELAWEQLLQRKRELVERLRQEKYLSVLASYPQITLHRGRARLTSGGSVEVDGKTVRTRRILIATGTRPGFPAIPGLTEARALDSTTAMELDRLPSSLTVIGAGSVGLELGQAFARFGVPVTVLEAAERILPAEEAEVSAELAGALRGEGIEIHTGVHITGVQRAADGFTVHGRHGSSSAHFRSEQLLVATGRVPNTEGLGLDAAGVETDSRGFIPVDEFMRTTHPTVFAAGDVTGGPGFVYLAALGGGIAAQVALAEGGEGPIPMDLNAVPRVVFTDPQVAAVGMNEAEARAAGLHVETTSLPVSALPRAVVSGRTQGRIKLVAEVGTGRLLGVHMVAANAGDVIGEAVLALRFGLTTSDLVSTLHPYLTWGEGLKLAGQTFTRDVSRLSCCA